MAGSIRWFQYNSNSGDRYAVQIDESNAKGVVYSNTSASGSPLFPSATQPFPGKAPRGFVMRSVACVGFLNRRARRRFWVGSRAVWDELLMGEKYVLVEGEYWAVVSGKEEKRPRPFLDPSYIDTGLDDGTVSQ